MQFQSIDYKIKMQLALPYSLSLKSSQTNIFPQSWHLRSSKIPFLCCHIYLRVYMYVLMPAPTNISFLV